MSKAKKPRSPRKPSHGKRDSATAFIDDRRRDFFALLQKRVQTALKGRNLSELAPKLGVKRETVYGWNGGRYIPDLPRLMLIAWHTGVPPSWLVLGEGTSDDARNLNPLSSLTEEYFLPREVLPGDPKTLPPIAFRRDWLLNLPWEGSDSASSARGIPASDFFLVEVKDDSMEPTLRRGEMLLVERGIKFRGQTVRPPDGLYLFKGGIVRRVQWQIDGSAVISCDNTKYPFEPRKIGRASERSEDFIIGRLVWRGGPI